MSITMHDYMNTKLGTMINDLTWCCRLSFFEQILLLFKSQKSLSVVAGGSCILTVYYKSLGGKVLVNGLGFISISSEEYALPENSLFPENTTTN